MKRVFIGYKQNIKAKKIVFFIKGKQLDTNNKQNCSMERRSPIKNGGRHFKSKQGRVLTSAFKYRAIHFVVSKV